MDFPAEFQLQDRSLDPFLEQIKWRRQHAVDFVKRMVGKNSILDLADSYKHFGFHRYNHGNESGIVYREWAPHAHSVSIVGDFNYWNIKSDMLHSIGSGEFEIFLPDVDGKSRIPHGSRVKCVVFTKDNHGNEQCLWRIPAHINRAVPNTQDNSTVYTGIYWDFDNLSTRYNMKRARIHPQMHLNNGLRIYECHIGMASDKEEVATFDYFRVNVLPRIKSNGYNCVQIMGIVEHAYYASFGYHCNCLYAVSSRFGTPEDFMRLVDAIHELDMVIIIDVIHSHASSNVEDGLNLFDGSTDQYFYPDARGDHLLWGSKCFNYSRPEVIRFLAGQLKFFVDVYSVDGFRFDGVTSILLNNHGINQGFTGSYTEYFGPTAVSMNEDSLAYCALVNHLLHSLSIPAISVAEDVSGYPLLGAPLEVGGYGFDYRMNLAIADMWIKLIKDCRVEDWNMGEIVHTILNRRYGEKYVSYNECHDQALVGDKTIAFRLMDKEMYYSMSISSPSVLVDRSIALIQLIRSITQLLGGEGFLNFMGNEFGHPEWIDFPREGNGVSYKYCKRQWHLVDDKSLKYQFINNWDRDINKFCGDHCMAVGWNNFVTVKDNERKIIAFEKNGFMFVMNYNYHTSFFDYPVPTHNCGHYKLIMTNDISMYGGFNRVQVNTQHFTHHYGKDGLGYSFNVYKIGRAHV